MNVPILSRSLTASSYPLPDLLFFFCCTSFTLLACALRAGPIPQNLGSGLDALVESNLKIKAAEKPGAAKLQLVRGFATEKAARMADFAIRDASGRVLVRVQPNGARSLADVQKAALSAAPSLKVQAVDTTYHGAGTFEGYVSLDDVPALARLEGVAAMHLTPKSLTARQRPSATNSTPGLPSIKVGEHLDEIGTVYDFGVTQHRVDQIDRIYNPSAPLNYEGRGISIGVLSSSYDLDPNTTTRAADDVASGDLPGTGNPVNSQPVVVLQDQSTGSDEGRAMCQTVYKMAPKARLGYATGNEGDISAANNIRALAGLPGYTYPAATQQGFKADVIVDDLVLPAEPFFQDGIIAQAIEDVTKAGVAYYAAAGNNNAVNVYDSDFRFVANGKGLTAAAGNSALTGTNINLANVPPALYAGGFHNFNPAAGQLDVAQTVNCPNATVLANDGGFETAVIMILRWNDPDDTTTPSLGAQVFEGSGKLTYNPSTGTANTVRFHLPLTKDQQYYFIERPAATPTTPGLYALDGIVTVTDASGNVVTRVDYTANGDAEYGLFFAPATGEYTVSVDAYEDPPSEDDYQTDGSFTLTLNKANGKERITQDLNLLVFDLNGNYLPDESTATNNFASNEAVDYSFILSPNSDLQVQFVISRTNPPPTSGRTADHLRYVCYGDGLTSLGPAEYFTYLTPGIFGHACANGCTAVGAYYFFKPSLPAFFSSPGPATMYFDANNKPYPNQQVRLKPDLAATTGANTTFFGGPFPYDEDNAPNFSGTSNAAPHAAAIAALVLEAHGGSGSVTPAQMKSVLQRSAFMHDLDPFFSSGTATTTEHGKVSITINSDDEDGVHGTTGGQDPNSFAVSYVGPGSLQTLVFNPSGAPTTGGNVTGGQNGLTPDGVYFQNNTPGVVFGQSFYPLTLGTCSPGLTAATVTAASANFATMPPNAVTAKLYFTQEIAFTPGVFTGGKVFHFTVGHYEYKSADVQTQGGSSGFDSSADLFGGGVSIPDGTLRENGMTFSGTTTSGGTFAGVIKNRLGAGYSPADGFGFINAEKAVTLPLK